MALDAAPTPTPLEVDVNLPLDSQVAPHPSRQHSLHQPPDRGLVRLQGWRTDLPDVQSKTPLAYLAGRQRPLRLQHHPVCSVVSLTTLPNFSILTSSTLTSDTPTSCSISARRLPASLSPERASPDDSSSVRTHWPCLDSAKSRPG